MRQVSFSRKARGACRALLVPAALLLGTAAPRILAGQPSTVPEPTDSTRKRLVARRAVTRLTIDGKLDEADWRNAPVAGDFAQARTDYVATTRYPTEVRVLFDDENLYIGAFNRDSAGLKSLRMPDLRRDFEPPENDVFGASIGPLGDRRTVLQFSTTPLGSQADVQAFDGGDAFNFNWDALWKVRTTRADSGWTAEFSIPWRSLRYTPGLTSWDINFVRNTRRVAQWSAWMPYPRQLSSWRISYGGVLDSIKPPPPRTNIRVRPYVLGTSVTDRATNAFNGRTGDVGGEIIWAPSANSLLEATVNTDFAQADVDRQVVNLTRFNVFLPERRQFFLENADLLNAGGLGATTIGGIGGVSGRYFVQPFFTRRIGLGDDGTPLPIDAGLRYAFRSGRTTAGALAMRQAANGAQGATTFGIVRGSRFFGRSTRIGATAALRDGDITAPDLTIEGRRNVVVAMDALARLGELTQFTGMLSASNENGRTGLAGTYGITRNTNTNLLGVLGAVVTRDYNPQMGFVSRPDVVMTNPFATWTVQPRWLPPSMVWIRHGPNAIAFNDPKSGRLQESNVTYTAELLFRNGATICQHRSGLVRLRANRRDDQKRPERAHRRHAHIVVGRILRRQPRSRRDHRTVVAESVRVAARQLRDQPVAQSRHARLELHHAPRRPRSAHLPQSARAVECVLPVQHRRAARVAECPFQLGVPAPFVPVRGVQRPAGGDDRHVAHGPLTHREAVVAGAALVLLLRPKGEREQRGN